jgi:hypothetical protein
MSENEGSPQKEQNAQIEAVIKFSQFLTSRYPQTDDMRNMSLEVNDGVHVQLPPLPDVLQTEPLLNYYLAGSLATTLLSRADTIDICEETTGSDITVSRTISNPPQSRAIFADFARPIGDIDYVTTDHYEALKKQAADSYGKVSDEEYRQSRKKFLWKGGGGPSFDEVPHEALPALKRSEGTLKIMCDPVAVYGAKKFARIEVGGQDIFIARPDTIITYKFLHALDSFNLKIDKFNTDFPKIFQAITGLYSEDELAAATHQALGDYEKALANVSTIFGKHHQPQLPAKMHKFAQQPLAPQLRSFMDKVVTYDHSHGHILGSTPLTAK